jgi:hypothetical protein
LSIAVHVRPNIHGCEAKMVPPGFAGRKCWRTNLAASATETDYKYIWDKMDPKGGLERQSCAV